MLGWVIADLMAGVDYAQYKVNVFSVSQRLIKAVDLLCSVSSREQYRSWNMGYPLAVSNQRRFGTHIQR